MESPRSEVSASNDATEGINMNGDSLPLGDLSPEGINKSHGKPTWTCWSCKAEADLHWHNGWSVAMCQKPECAAKYDAMCKRQTEEQEAFDQYVMENY